MPEETWFIIPKSNKAFGDKYEKTLVAITKHVNAKILLLRGQKVILDADSAELYGVEIKQLNQQIERNRKRFPEDFVFSSGLQQLTKNNARPLSAYGNRTARLGSEIGNGCAVGIR